MSHYLLSVHAGAGEPRTAPDEESTRTYMERIGALEDEMRASGALVFSGRLDEPGASTVVRANGAGALTTDGPYLESKEAIAGFYIIEAPDADAALSWATKTAAVVGMPIELRPFTGAHQG